MSSRKAIFNSDSEEELCKECFWLIQFVGGDCCCALGNEWPSELEEPHECNDYVGNKIVMAH